MKQYRLLEITSQYNQYLRKFYNEHNDIDKLSYNELFSMLIEDCFADSNFIHLHLNKMGIESKIIFNNNRNLQDKWNPDNKDMSYFDILLAQIRDYSPDVIFITDVCRFTKEETAIIKNSLPNKKIKLVAFHFTVLNDRFKQNALLYDQVYTGSRFYVKIMRDYGIPAYLLRHAFEPGILERLPKTERKNEVCFPGSIYVGRDLHNNRLDMLNILEKFNVPYTFYGNVIGNVQTEDDQKYLSIIKEIEKNKKPSVFGIHYFSVLNQYNICLNLHSPFGSVSAGNMRMFEATGIGTCLLTDYRSENSELFDVDREIVEYKSFEEMVEKAKWLLDNPKSAREIAMAGQKKTFAKFTFKNKAEQLNEYIQELLK